MDLSKQIDDMDANEIRKTLHMVADAFGIGFLSRDASTILVNAQNAARRSSCLGMIEDNHTETMTDDEGEPFVMSLLNWGEAPNQYIETYRKVLGDKGTRVAELESKRNSLIHREHEASSQMFECHKILDRLGAPRDQDNGLSYHLNGRLSRLVAGETGKLWAAEMQTMTALLRRARACIPDAYEDEVAVRTAINTYLNAHQG